MAYAFLGYGLAFGDGNPFCGDRYFGLAHLPDDRLGHLFFHYTFAATAATIPSGVMVGRCTTTAYVTYTLLVSAFSYPIASHWAWAPEGWLNSLGYNDFAGSGVVHLLGGTTGVVASAVVGPRTERLAPDGSFKNILGHNIPVSIPFFSPSLCAKKKQKNSAV